MIGFFQLTDDSKSASFGVHLNYLRGTIPTVLVIANFPHYHEISLIQKVGWSTTGMRTKEQGKVWSLRRLFGVRVEDPAALFCKSATDSTIAYTFRDKYFVAAQYKDERSNRCTEFINTTLDQSPRSF